MYPVCPSYFFHWVAFLPEQKQQPFDAKSTRISRSPTFTSRVPGARADGKRWRIRTWGDDLWFSENMWGNQNSNSCRKKRLEKGQRFFSMMESMKVFCRSPDIWICRDWYSKPLSWTNQNSFWIDFIATQKRLETVTQYDGDCKGIFAKRPDQSGLGIQVICPDWS